MRKRFRICIYDHETFSTTPRVINTDSLLRVWWVQRAYPLVEVLDRKTATFRDAFGATVDVTNHPMMEG